MKVVILCGGMGTRLREETEIRPKPMVEIGGRPILWHIMQTYAHHGYRDFVLCLGYKGEQIKHFFCNYEVLTHDVTVDLATGGLTFHRGDRRADWRVTLAETGLAARTGARVKRVQRYVDSDLFMLTYGDGLTNLDLRRLEAFHRGHGKIGTLTGVTPPSRYGELNIVGDRVLTFREKPEEGAGLISGGYFVFSRRFFDYLGEDDDCVLEREPLERLAKDGELMVHAHRGFWQCMDTARDLEYLKELWAAGAPPWRVW